MPICPLISLLSFTFPCLTADGLLLKTCSSAGWLLFTHVIGRVIRNHFEIIDCGLMPSLGLLPFVYLFPGHVLSMSSFFDAMFADSEVMKRLPYT